MFCRGSKNVGIEGLVECCALTAGHWHGPSFDRVALMLESSKSAGRVSCSDALDDAFRIEREVGREGVVVAAAFEHVDNLAGLLDDGWALGEVRAEVVGGAERGEGCHLLPRVGRALFVARAPGWEEIEAVVLLEGNFLAVLGDHVGLLWFEDHGQSVAA